MIVDNRTHWRTSDVKRVVKAALERGEHPIAHVEIILITWTTGARAHSHAYTLGPKKTVIKVSLPKKGPKHHHKNAMLAVACAAGQKETDAEVLAFQEVFRFANVLAYSVAVGFEREKSVERLESLLQAVGTTAKPDWAPLETFQIQKYKDPLKDGTYLDFVAKKQKEIDAVQNTIVYQEGLFAEAKAAIKSAKKRKRVLERALQAARARRT